MKDSRKRRSVNRLLCALVCLCAVTPGFTQDLPVFGWQSHYSYQDIQHLAVSQERLIAGTPLVGFFYDHEDQSINLLNKNTGLSDIGISAIAASSDGQTLAIGYENGNLDLLDNNVIQNITDILAADNISDKKINALVFRASELWIGTDFGMVRYSLSDSVILESYQNIGEGGARVAINDFVLTNDSIYAASDDGILSVSLDDQTNRQDFNFWQRQLTGISFEEIAEDGIRIVASAENDLFTYESSQWNFQANLPSPIQQIETLESGIYLLSQDAFYTLNENETELILEAQEEVFQCFVRDNDETFIGTEKKGVLIFNDQNSDPVALPIPGPLSDHHFASLKKDNEFLWLSMDGISQWQPESGIWTALNLINNENNVLITDPTDVEHGQQLLISSFSEGLFVQLEEDFEPIENISPSHTLIKENGSVNLQAMANAGNTDIWFLQRGRNPPLHLWDQNSNNWTSFNLKQSRASQLNDLFIIDNGDKWLPVNDDFGGGIIVYNEGNGRERYLNINGGQGGLPGSKVNDIVQDQDRFIWVATDEGICFFPSPEEILTGVAITANVPIFDGGLLLRDEHITAVAIDPANRKWFGTANNGVWLFSETGEELLQHFTTSNSPLPDNHIIDISIDDLTGIVFFVTEKGLISFRSDATEGTNTHQNVVAYPNPVPSNFNGRLVIEGLVNNAQLRITDTSGKLVRQLNANGSTATWNVRDQNGSRVSSGVYFIFSSNEDGSESYVGKIVVI